MTWKHWFGLLAGAGAGVAIAWALHRYAEFDEPATTESTGEFGYEG